MSRHLAQKLFIAAFLLSSSIPAWAEPLLHVYAIRGFAGVVFSRGMNTLCEELANMPEVACTVENYYNAPSIEEQASQSMAAGQVLILVGHSLGAHAALKVAGAMQGSIPLIVTIDPNWFAPPAIPPNVEVVLNYYQNFDVLGRATLQAPPGFRGELQQFPRKEPHIMIDGSADIHAEIIRRIKAILANLNSPPVGASARRRFDTKKQTR